MNQHRICEFGFPGPLRDRLVSAVLSGAETATTSLLAEWEADGEKLPEAGEQQTVIDSAGVPVATIEIVRRLSEVDDAVARAEGEDHSTAAGWRTEHERFWFEEVLPAWEDGEPPGDLGRHAGRRAVVSDQGAALAILMSHLATDRT